MDLWDSTVRMLSALAVVLGAMVVVFYVARRVMHKRGGWLGSGPMIQVLGNLYLGGKKSITVVEVGGEVLVVGATPGDMVLLSKIRKAEWNTEMKVQNDECRVMNEVRNEAERSRDYD